MAEQQQQFSLEQLQGLLGRGGGGGGGGLFGLGDIATGGLLGFGGELLGQLGGLFGGDSAGEKRLKSTFDLLQNQLGRDVLDTDQFLAQFRRENAERFGREDEASARRVGLDSFLFTAGAQNRREGQERIQRGQFEMENARLKSQRDLDILRQLAGIGAALG